MTNDRAEQSPAAAASNHDQLQASARDHLMMHFAKQEIDDLLVLDRGEGCYVYDTRGKRYIDALSSLFCAQLGYGYGHEMAVAATQQLERLPFNTNWATAHPAAIQLADKIASLAPGGDFRVFFTGGGSESVESAWKLTREHFLAIGQPQRIKAIARKTAYHGVTLGALALTGVAKFKDDFGTPPIEVTHVSSTNAFRSPLGADPAAYCQSLLDEVESAILDAGPDEVALIIAEPVQNAGGCYVAPPGYWAGLRRLADQYGALLMADEVITGFGRLGEWFGISREDVIPDLISVAKGLTSAYAPMGALLAGSHVVQPLIDGGQVFRHGITFAGHPVSAAIALKSIEILERDSVLENVRALEGYLHERLDELRVLPIVGDVRGAGFFWAIELVKDEANTRFDQSERDRLLRGYLPRRLREAGIIARCDDRGDAVMQIAPPLVSTRELLDDIVDALAEVLTDTGAYMGLPAPVALEPALG